MVARFKKSDVLYFGFGVILLAILPLYFLYDPGIPGVFPSCPFLSITGLYCTGCGSQRALHDLLHLNIPGVLRYNLLFLPAIGFAGYHLFIKFLAKFSSKRYISPVHHTNAPRIILIIVVVFTVLRNIPGYPFNLLAP